MELKDLIKRHYTKSGQTMDGILQGITWTTRHIEVRNKNGEISFAGDVSFPSFWSDTAARITASRYFYRGNDYFENSLSDMIIRVVSRFSEWLYKKYPVLKTEDAVDSYKNIFQSELTYILLHQIAAFNSPVYFNLGIKKKAKGEHPEICSACYITNIDDDMNSIKEFQNIEFDIFKSGAGNGANFSNLRGSMEHIKGGGTSSGPISFMEALDAWAGRIRSGGRLRRAAIMRVLDVDHPNIEEFITCKVKEEERAKSLLDAGYSGGIDGEAYKSVFFQNENHSVRVDNDFMNCVLSGNKYPLRYRKDENQDGTDVYKYIDAKDLLYSMADSCWSVGDPGLQFKDTINEWNTIPNSGEIRSSNPCLTLDSHILTPIGFKTLGSLLQKKQRGIGSIAITTTNSKDELIQANSTDAGVFLTRENANIFKVIFSNGLTQKFTGDHLFQLKNNTYKKLLDIEPGDQLKDIYFKQIYDIDINNIEDYEKGILSGWFFGDGSWIHNSQGHDSIQFAIGINEFDYESTLLDLIHKYIDKNAKINPHFQKPESCHEIKIHRNESINNAISIGIPEFKELFDISNFSKSFKIGFLRGLSTTDGSIRRNGDAIEIYSIYRNKLEDMLRTMLEFGCYGTISAHNHDKIYTAKDGKIRNNKTTYKIQSCDKNAKWLLRPLSFFKDNKLNHKENDIYSTRYAKIFITQVEECEPEDVYDISVPEYERFICGGGCVVHNCSEVFNIDNTSCNLASINLGHFLGEHGIEYLDLEYAINYMVMCQDLIVDYADYPHHLISEWTKKTRNIGLGITNLGDILMRLGLPYDSQEARDISSSIMAFITATAYTVSSIISSSSKSFPLFDENKDAILHILGLHKLITGPLSSRYSNSIASVIAEKANTKLIKLIESILSDNSLANCYVTCLAPCGTISFMMDAQTTGIEPELSLVKYKSIVGEDTIKIVNESIGPALLSLGYPESQIHEIRKYILDHETIDGAPYLSKNHYKIFQCSLGKNEDLVVSPMGHIKMVAALQPAVSQGISKTINCPEHTTVEEIFDMYIQAWKLGLKCISIYRDNSKNAQPLTTKEENEEADEESVAHHGVSSTVFKPFRKHLPVDRNSITHKFSIGNIDGYLTVGMYDDGKPGEIFITMAKIGTFASGMIDCFATTVSIGLQYGVPLYHLIDKFKGTKFEPSGLTENDKIRFTTSVVDYIGRWLEDRFITPIEQEHKKEEPATTINNSVNNPVVMNGNTKYSFNVCQCGGLLVRSGTCEVCSVCGETTGCS